MDESYENNKSKENDESIEITEKTYAIDKNTWWSALPLCQYKLTSIRFDLKTIKILADNENITIDEFLNIINKSKRKRSKYEKMLRNLKKLIKDVKLMVWEL